MYRRERIRLHAYLLRRVGRDEAGDVLQETFLRAAASAAVEQLDNPGAFLFCIARNILIDRARRRASGMVTLPLEPGDHPEQHATQELEIEARQTAARITAAIARMGPKTRRVFEMSRFEERTYREIHEELGISVATVEYHMMKALGAVREALAKGA